MAFVWAAVVIGIIWGGIWWMIHPWKRRILENTEYSKKLDEVAQYYSNNVRILEREFNRAAKKLDESMDYVSFMAGQIDSITKGKDNQRKDTNDTKPDQTGTDTE